MSQRIVLVDGEVDIPSRRVRREKVTLSLTPKEAELLEYLTQRPGRVISRDELLRTVWNYKAGVVSRTVDATVRRLREKIEEDHNHPVQLVTMHGEGYRWNPLEPPVDVPKSNLVGRKGDLARLIRAIQPGTALTVVGPGGIGKTSVLKAVLTAAPEVVWVDLTGCLSVEWALERLEMALGLVPGAAGRRVGRIKRAFQSREEVWCVLDAAELLPEIGECLVEWCSHCPRVSFVLGSRRLLEFAGERAFELPPLTVGDGAELLVRRWQPWAPEGATLENEALGPLVRAAQGNPLELQWLAAELQVASPAEILRDWASRADDRLPQVWEWLSEPERKALAPLAVFAGSIPWDAAKEMFGTVPAEGVRRWTAAGLLVRETAEEVRFRLPDRVRTFLWARLNEGERISVERQFFAWMGSAALRWSPLPWGCTRVADQRRLMQERPHLQRTVHGGNAEEAWAAWWGMATTWPESELPSMPSMPPPAGTELERSCRGLQFEFGGPDPGEEPRSQLERFRRLSVADLDAAEPEFERLKKFFSEDKEGLGRVYQQWATALGTGWRNGRVMEFFRESDRCLADDNARVRLTLERSLATWAYSRGEVVTALSAYERAFRLAEGLGDPVLTASVRVGLANVRGVLRQSEASMALLEAAVRDLRRYDMGTGFANRVAMAAITARELGHSQTALDWFYLAEEGMRAKGERFRARWWVNVARTWLDLGEYQRAEHAYHEALAHCSGVERGLTASHLGLAYHLQQKSDAEQWYAVAEQSLPQLTLEDRVVVRARVAAWREVAAVQESGNIGEDVRLAADLYESVVRPEGRARALEAAHAVPPAMDVPMVSFASAFTEVRFALKVALAGASSNAR